MLFGDKHQKVQKALEKKNEAALIKLISDKDDAVALEAIAALGKIGSDDGFNALIPVLHSTMTEKRVAAANALGEIGNVHARAHLSYQLQKEKDAVAKKAMEDAMNKISEKF